MEGNRTSPTRSAMFSSDVTRGGNNGMNANISYYHHHATEIPKRNNHLESSSSSSSSSSSLLSSRYAAHSLSPKSSTSFPACEHHHDHNQQQDERHIYCYSCLVDEIAHLRKENMVLRIKVERSEKENL